MRNKIIKQITKALASRTSFFLREISIQIYLADYFIKTNLYDNVFVEYHIPKKLIPDYPWSDKIDIDIVLEKNGKYFPIEIKYKTKQQILPLMIFGQDENICLGKQGAQNDGCYFFLKDVKRIEMCEELFINVERGIVLFMSNDPSYQIPPSKADFEYAQFSTHQGRYIPANSLLSWNKKIKTKEPKNKNMNKDISILLKYDYTIDWIPLKNIPEHYYILL
jgi:hypothetical protein